VASLSPPPHTPAESPAPRGASIPPVAQRLGLFSKSKHKPKAETTTPSNPPAHSTTGALAAAAAAAVGTTLTHRISPPGQQAPPSQSRTDPPPPYSSSSTPPPPYEPPSVHAAAAAPPPPEYTAIPPGSFDPRELTDFQLDELVHRIIGRITRLIRTELRMDRERIGKLRDPRH
jgi:hypothetical protein